MKVKIDDEELFEIADFHKKVICYKIREPLFDRDIRERLFGAIDSKYRESLKQLKHDWEDKLKSRYESIPSSDQALCELIFSQPDYKDREARYPEELAMISGAQ